jgi:hypothetical protein
MSHRTDNYNISKNINDIQASGLLSETFLDTVYIAQNKKENGF